MQTVKLTSRREVAPAVYELLFTRPEGWTFEAGQFAASALPPTATSPSSAPTRSQAHPKPKACAFS